LFYDTKNDFFNNFITGLFGSDAYKTIDATAEKSDSILLRPYDSCPLFEEQEDAAEGPDSEFIKFQQTDVFKNMLNDVSLRLGYNYTLSFENISLIWEMCRFEQAWFVQNSSAWCAAFLPEHVNILEYLEDLQYFYEAGHVHQLNSNLMCAAIQDMLRFMQTDQMPKVTAYFAHSTSIQLFLTGLGYGKDSELLKADNYNQMTNRKFKTSVISPFASNVAAVKYE
jgi:multiple inositol-polyphosphate phosphatase / 2,3-bisphosphoglycerate 3-phosphatase